MKMTNLVILIVMIAVALFLVLPNLSWAAEDGAAIYKAKCAACHGADLAGNRAAKIPSLVSDEARKASNADLIDMIANGGRDKKAMQLSPKKA
jgi:cytochrome c553